MAGMHQLKFVLTRKQHPSHIKLAMMHQETILHSFKVSLTKEDITPFLLFPPFPCINVSYLVGVPGYRISQMVAAGGKILDAYGLVNVVSPSGLPMRGIVGISPDPIMFVAINCKDVKESQSFYEQLGFIEQVSRYSRD